MTARSPSTTDAGDPIGARAVIALGIAALSGAGAALLSWLASGSIGPGRLAEVGPEPGPVALAVGLEVLVGAAILLLSPRRRARRPAAEADARDAGPVPASGPDPASGGDTSAAGSFRRRGSGRLGRRRSGCVLGRGCSGCIISR